MKVDAIIFDKDGTLLDFDAFWVAVTEKAVKSVLDLAEDKITAVTEVLEAFGVHNGVTDIEGVLCKGTYTELGEILHDIMKSHGISKDCDYVAGALRDAYKKSSGEGEIKPTCEGLANVLSELKRQGKKLAVVTTDNAEITTECLKGLGILEFFDKIYSDDGKTPTKPDPYCVYDFCETFGVKKESVCMVGDTMTDMNFAKNAGISAIGIAKNENNAKILEPHAYAVINDPSFIFDVLN